MDLWCNISGDMHYLNLIGASLSEPHTSVTVLSTCVHLAICACLDWPLTIIPNERIQNFNISRCPRRRVLQLSVKGYWQTARSAWKRARVKTIQVECIGSTHGNLLSELWWVWRSRDKAGYEWQTAGCTLASGMRLAWPFIHSMDPPASSWFDCEA